MSEPPASPTPSIAPLDGALFGEDSPCFGCGPSHPIGFRLAFTREEDRVCTRFVPGAQYQGPPGVMHGGLVTALADELAAWTIIALKGRFGFTTTIEARLSRPVRVGVEVLGTSRITRDLQRIVEVETTLSQREELAYTAKFKFAVLDRAAAERLLGGPLPPRWAAFAR
jgi:acyl-coenzyme A thioesterase PaaI-like protein